jgi:8-oxo-dGTP pyrophosphatase MutT (NUDIX family)
MFSFQCNVLRNLTHVVEAQVTDFRLRCQKLYRDEPRDWNRSDDDMNQRARLLAHDTIPIPAAVLVGVVFRTSGPCVLLTQRTETLKKHAGQIAFPGGRIDAGETAVTAALREASEEIALKSNFVEPLGFLDGYLTITGYLVKPVVAIIHEGFSTVAQQDEVADIFEVPLEFLTNSSNLRVDSREFKGVQRHYFVYPYGQRYIWGATAGMLKSMSDRLYS